MPTLQGLTSHAAGSCCTFVPDATTSIPPHGAAKLRQRARGGAVQDSQHANRHTVALLCCLPYLAEARGKS